MTLLALTLAVAFGWLLGVWMVTAGLRGKIADLDAERLELDVRRKQLDRDRDAYVEAVDTLLELEAMRFPKKAQRQELRP